MSGRRCSRSLTPASSTNSDSSGEYMGGFGMPVSASASSIPVSSGSRWSAHSAERLTLPRLRSMSLPSCLRSLSLAVIDTTRAPWRENSAMMVRERSSSGPVITTASPVSRSR